MVRSFTDSALCRLRLATGAAALAVSLVGVAPSAQAQQVTNPGFETGDTSGWTANGGIWSSGTYPPPPSEYSGPPTKVTVVGAGTDPNTGAPTVFQGAYAARLNDYSGGNDISALTQKVTNYNGNKLYYAWNAVLEPSHGATDSPSFIIQVVDETTGQIITNIAYSAYNAQGSNIFRPAGQFVTTDWKVEDIDMTLGHDYKLVFVAVDCLYGGHAGYVYVDGFGNAIPVANAGVTFNPATDVVKGATFLLPIGGVVIPDIDTAKAAYTTADLSANLVKPNFIGGTLQLLSGGAVTTPFTVQSQGGTIDTNGFNALFSGGLTGSGGMAKTGLGTLTLGGVSTLSGRFAVNQGVLAVNGALSLLGVDVNSGGMLSGGGTVVGNVNVAAGGTLNPGDAIGALKVVGNVALAPTAKFGLDIDGRNYNPAGGAGSYDRLVMSGGSGTFTAGGIVAPNLRNIAGGNNNFTPVLGDSFTVVTADNVTGQFASVAQPTAGMAANTRFDVLYGAKTVSLVLTPGNFATLGKTAGWKINAISAAGGLDAVRPAAGTRAGTLQSLFNGLYGMTAPQLGVAFQQIGGEIHTHTMQMEKAAALGANREAMGAALDFGDCTGGTIGMRNGAVRVDDQGCADDRNRHRPSVWGRFIADYSHADEDGTSYGYGEDRYGVIAGVNVIDNDTTRLGIGGRYTEGDIKTFIGSSAKSKGGSAFVYGATRLGPVDLGATFGWHTASIDTNRDLTLLSGTSTSHGSYKVESLSAAMEARGTILLGKTAALRPVVGVEWARTHSDAVAETSATANVALALPARTWETVNSRVGAEAKVGLGQGLEAHVSGDWRHTLSGNPTASRLAALGPATWTVSSVVADKDTYDMGAGLTARISENIKMRVDYTGTRGGAYKADGGSVGLSVRF